MFSFLLLSACVIFLQCSSSIPAAPGNESVLEVKIDRALPTDINFSSNTTKFKDNKDISDDRIVGGSTVPIQNFRYQVSLKLGGFLCGGSLVRYNWVLTAGHCVEGIKVGAITVRAGSNKYKSGGVTARASKIIHHADYGTGGGNLAYDVALVKLRNSFRRFKDHYPIRTIELAKRLPQDGAKCTVTGFGTIYFEGPTSDLLKKVVVKKINKSLCNKNYEGDIPVTGFCAGKRIGGGKDACQGDSGGPLVKNHKQIGIVSFGEECALGKYPGVYTSVPYMRKWILHAIRTN